METSVPLDWSRCDLGLYIYFTYDEYALYIKLAYVKVAIYNPINIKVYTLLIN